MFSDEILNRPIGCVTRHLQLILAVLACVAGRACLELGAGTGVVGLTLGRLGADFHQHSAAVVTSTVVTWGWVKTLSPW